MATRGLQDFTSSLHSQSTRKRVQTTGVRFVEKVKLSARVSHEPAMSWRPGEKHYALDAT